MSSQSHGVITRIGVGTEQGMLGTTAVVEIALDHGLRIGDVVSTRRGFEIVTDLDRGGLVEALYQGRAYCDVTRPNGVGIRTLVILANGHAMRAEDGHPLEVRNRRFQLRP